MRAPSGTSATAASRLGKIFCFMKTSACSISSQCVRGRSRMGHVFGADELVEFLASYEPEFNGGFAKTAVFVMRGVRDFRGVIVADLWREGGDEHQGSLDVVVDLFPIDFNAVGAMFDKAVAGVGKQLDGMQIIKNHHRLKNVQLKVALRSCKADGRIVAHHLSGDHGERFALRGIYFAGHDGRAGLVFWKRQFAETAAWTGG